VASGAMFQADGDVTLSALKLSTIANGTISGFTFAASGTLDVEGTDAETMPLPVTFNNCQNLDNLENWTLSVNGQEKPSRTVSVSDNGVVTIVSHGTVIILK
jgi:hypothetical protein